MDNAQTFTVASWNIQATYFDLLDKTSNKLHSWERRKGPVLEAIQRVDADFWGLQELCPQQALDLQVLDQYGSFFLPLQADLLEDPVVLNRDNLQELTQRDDLLLNGILYKKSTWKLASSGGFLLLHDNREVQDIFGESKNRLATMVEFRGVAYGGFIHTDTKRKVFIFSSHYPVGNSESLQIQCATTERENIDRLAGSEFWISMGDRNNFGTQAATVNMNSLAPLMKDAFNAWSWGPLETTYVGFGGTMWDNPLVNGYFQNKLVIDTIISNHPSVSAEHILPEFNWRSGKVTFNPEQFGESRSFASDHALVKAIYEF
jgi:hypothetical protein